MLVPLLLAISCLAVATAAAFGRQVRVSCIGDSITQGACGSEGYPAKLQRILGEKYLVGNYGNSGKTMLSHGLCEDGTSCAYFDTATWPSVLGSEPDIVTIMMGTNDAKSFNWFGVQDNRPDSYVLDYLTMIKALAALPSRPVIFAMTTVPLYEPYPFAMNATVINEFLSANPQGLIPQVASLANVHLIDIHAAFQGYSASITCDGCHPTDEGFEVIAKAMAPYIEKASLTIRKEV